MTATATRILLPALALAVLAGCAQPDKLKSQDMAADPKTPGVTTNSGGDTRGTVLFEPGPVPVKPADPYAAVSGKFVLPVRQKMAWELAEIDDHAHRQAASAYPVPEASSPNYSKLKARETAEQQAQFNAYLLEKYYARFCNRSHISYDQLALIIQEGRDKNWPMPPSSG